jgi:hypothetical protein
MRVLIALMCVFTAVPVFAQDRRARDNDRTSQGIPPGHLPPPGECRVWYDGRPPGQQPPPTSCREAERVVSRERRARVIYGNDSRRGNESRRGIRLPGWLGGRDQRTEGRDREREREAERRDQEEERNRDGGANRVPPEARR